MNDKRKIPDIQKEPKQRGASYRIAICDDEKLTCSELEKCLKKISQNLQIHSIIDVFYSGSSLCEFLLKSHFYDLIFLDIELGSFNGIDTGDFIRNKLNDTNTLIVYISYKQNYALKLFRIGSFDFLIKPLTIETVQPVLSRAIKQITKLNSVFVYSAYNKSYRIKLNDILYFQSNLRKIIIVTATDNMEFYGCIDDVFTSLPNNLFLRIHKSYLVNLNHVSKHTYEFLELDNQVSLTISKTYRPQVRKQMMEAEIDND